MGRKAPRVTVRGVTLQRVRTIDGVHWLSVNGQLSKIETGLNRGHKGTWSRRKNGITFEGDIQKLFDSLRTWESELPESQRQTDPRALGVPDGRIGDRVMVDGRRYTGRAIRNIG